MQLPLISVILPVKDGGEFLRASVESILGQGLTDLELLLVDDHSSDLAIAELTLDDHRLVLLKNPGNGVVSAFNHGLENARGRFIARMDADDIAMENRLEVQVGYLQENPDIGIAGASVEIFSESGLRKGNRLYQEWLNSVRTPQDISRQLFIESPIPNPTAMYRREILLKLGGYRDTHWPEDYDLFLRADQAGILMGKPKSILLHWRDHEGRLTRCDERYSRQRFQIAKAHFLARGRLPAGPMLIWGAGVTGAEMHDLLEAEGVETSGFIDVHPRRVGGQKRGKPVFPVEHAATPTCPFIVVAVGARGAREKIRAFMNNAGRVEDEHYLFVS